MSSLLLSMVMFSLAGAISPGPVNVIASSVGARLGFVAALPHVAGASLSYCGVIWLMGTSLQKVLLGYPWVANLTQYLGAAYLLYLAVRIARTPDALDDSAVSTSQPTWRLTQGFTQGVLVQSLNPKAWLVALSGVSLFITDRQDTHQQLLFFCAVSGSVCFVSVAAWAALGTLIRQWLAQARYQRLFHRALAAFLVFAVWGMLTPHSFFDAQEVPLPNDRTATPQL